MQVANVLLASPSKLKGDVARSLTAHLIAAQEEGSSLDVDPAGKPQTWVKVITGQISSSTAAQRTLWQRTAEL